MTGILVANRGEVAVRVMRAAEDLGRRCVAVFARDDAASLHTRRADEAHALPGEGVAALPRPGPAAPRRPRHRRQRRPPRVRLPQREPVVRPPVRGAGGVFTGPPPELIELFGDKARARGLAQRLDVPVLTGTTGATSLDEARAFAAERGPVMVKALAEGGGRGIRPVRSLADLDEAHERCCSEARQAFGDERV